MNTILLTITLVCFISYVAFIWIKYGIQESISASYYKLPRNLQWLFTIATWGYAFPAIMLGVPYSLLAFLAGAAICFVSASPAFRGKDKNDHTMEGTVHMVGAIVGVTAAQLMIFLAPFSMWYINVGFLALCGVSYLIPKMKVNFTWWIELYAFISIVLAYYLKIF